MSMFGINIGDLEEVIRKLDDVQKIREENFAKAADIRTLSEQIAYLDGKINEILTKVNNISDKLAESSSRQPSFSEPAYPARSGYQDSHPKYDSSRGYAQQPVKSHPAQQPQRSQPAEAPKPQSVTFYGRILNDKSIVEMEDRTRATVIVHAHGNEAKVEFNHECVDKLAQLFESKIKPFFDCTLLTTSSPNDIIATSTATAKYDGQKWVLNNAIALNIV